MFTSWKDSPVTSSGPGLFFVSFCFPIQPSLRHSIQIPHFLQSQIWQHLLGVYLVHLGHLMYRHRIVDRFPDNPFCCHKVNSNVFFFIPEFSLELSLSLFLWSMYQKFGLFLCFQRINFLGLANFLYCFSILFIIFHSQLNNFLHSSCFRFPGVLRLKAR